jgi:hypothetical protein
MDSVCGRGGLFRRYSGGCPTYGEGVVICVGEGDEVVGSLGGGGGGDDEIYYLMSDISTFEISFPYPFSPFSILLLLLLRHLYIYSQNNVKLNHLHKQSSSTNVDKIFLHITCRGY